MTTLARDNEGSTLADFILARVVEWEGVAKAATEAPWALSEDRDEQDVALRGKGGAGPSVAVTVPLGYESRRANATHIAAHDPARVLAQCEAYRQIVAAHDGRLLYDLPFAATHPCDGTLGVIDCDTLRALAGTWSDHKDWQAGWAS